MVKQMEFDLQSIEKKEYKFIDLFAGMGGIRLGFEQALKEYNIKPNCILTAEIKQAAKDTLKHNFEHRKFLNDITKINPKELEDFDFLLAGFPCQAFSSAGNRDGFCDTRGTLFFEVEKILKEKKPYGFLLENVEGLVNHDKGKTLDTIIHSLNNLGYKTNWKVLDSKDFGLAQSRKRIYIIGTLKANIRLENFDIIPNSFIKDIQEHKKEVKETVFTKKLFSHFNKNELYGKSIKDKRGGSNNIHSWDFGLKGEITEEQRLLMTTLLKERRKKHWAEKIGIEWMDGMPLTTEQIKTFYNHNKLQYMLDDLVEKGYLKYEHPKTIVEKQLENTNIIKRREYDISKPKGYNIVTGKLSFEFSKILDPNDITPTLVATDVDKLGIIDNNGIRKLTLREGLRLFGFPENYSLDIFEKNISSRRKAFDLLGNTVAIPVIYQISKKLIHSFKEQFQ
jgi:DNA (cytosine-5)-methyltransferase 1